jgi:hypothetical protein
MWSRVSCSSPSECVFLKTRRRKAGSISRPVTAARRETAHTDRCGQAVDRTARPAIKRQKPEENRDKGDRNLGLAAPDLIDFHKAAWIAAAGLAGLAICVGIKERSGMGYWKDVRERLGGGNPEAHEDEYVCAACIADEVLQGFIEGEARAKVCTFCGAESNDPIAAPLVEILLYMSECLDREFDAAENKLPYESAEGGYIGQVWTTEEVLEDHLGGELPNDDDGTLMEALCDGLGDRAWCRKHTFSLTDDEKPNFS